MKTITTGSDATVNVNFKLKSNRKSAPLTGFSSATGSFPNADGTYLAVSGTLVSADLGEVEFVITKDQSILLNVGEEQDFQVNVEANGVTTVSVARGVLNIAPKLV